MRTHYRARTSTGVGHPGLTAPLVGAKSQEQLAPALAAADLDLDPELRDRLSALTPAPPPAHDRTEEQSR